jgi:RNA polymerase subunit RPABC4/transcription elongation factor Spt4
MSVCEIKDCINCGTQGKVLKAYPSGITKIRCPACGQDWNTFDIKKAALRCKLQVVSKTHTCPVCGKNSGYPGGGICKSCYKAGHRQVPIKAQRG